MEKIIKESPLSQDEIVLLREQYVIEYAKKKGWDSNKLSTTQLLEIVESKGYKQPMILS